MFDRGRGGVKYTKSRSPVGVICQRGMGQGWRGEGATEIPFSGALSSDLFPPFFFWGDLPLFLIQETAELVGAGLAVI